MAQKLQGHNGISNLPKHPKERVELAECLREQEKSMTAIRRVQN